ncbi:MAG: NAD-dependent malic enzyme [Propionibacteriaceae bacterium]|jgi:malate dehydrogenase (oxaloacetate-decarboxylating)|nr:NAD-dependent malic enzyme [Propionibacteriaceae bacterium]
MRKQDYELDTTTRNGVLKLRMRGRNVLNDPMVTKGTAFTHEERKALGLSGLLPSGVTSIEEQIRRLNQQYDRVSTNLAKNIFLHDLRARNEVLFYRFIAERLEETLPIIYTPTIGDVIERFSYEFHGTRAVFTSIDRPEMIEQNLMDFGLDADDVDLVVATDSGGILGIGDQGIGGVQIAIGKLEVYTAAAGIHPKRAIPVVLDVGTDNLGLLNSELYLGERHPRVTGQRYDEFIDAFVKAVNKLFPNALLHWEDFGTANAHRILSKYKDECCTFNDDIQGTAAVVLAAMLSGVRRSGLALKDHTIAVYGAGTAGIGIADIIRSALVKAGLTEAEAYKKFWVFNSRGLVVDDLKGVRDFQMPYARKRADVKGWKVADPRSITLEETVKNLHPTILIGCSAQPGAFTKEIIEELLTEVKRPIIMPLSNPTSMAEATPSDLIEWSDARALVATGSPYPAFRYNGTSYTIAQANNALIFPGLGLGVSVVKARRVTDSMVYAAATGLAGIGSLRRPGAGLLPSMRDLRMVAATVALAVAQQAIEEGVAQVEPENLLDAVWDRMWTPDYPPLEIAD